MTNTVLSIKKISKFYHKSYTFHIAICLLQGQHKKHLQRMQACSVSLCGLWEEQRQVANGEFGSTSSAVQWAAIGKDSFLPQLHLFLCSAVSPPSVSNLIPRSKSEIVVITVKTGLFTTLTIMSHMLFSFYSTTSTIKRNSFLWSSYIIVR